MVRMKDEKYYLHVRDNVAPEKDESPELPVYGTLSRLDRELDERHLLNSSLTAGFLKFVLCTNRFRVVRLQINI